MAENKKSFLLYCDIKDLVNKLPDDKAGLLFKHILKYVNDENPITDDFVVDIAFEPIKKSLQRDLKKYEKRAENSRKNGALGGRPPKENINPQKPTGFNNNPEEPRKPDSVSDSVSDINNNNVKLKFDWDELIKYFNEVTGKKTRIIPEKAKSAFLARLKEGFTKQDVADAIVNCFNDDFHKENNHKNLTLEFISRSDKLEKYSSLKPKMK